MIQPHPSQTPPAASRSGSFHARRLVLTLGLGIALLGPAATVAQSPSAAPGAVDVVDDEGTRLVLAAPPERVISLSPANTEIAFAVGAGDRVVGGTDYDDTPAEAVALPDVATYQGVLMEQVVALDPDLVLASGNGFTSPADIARMRELGFPVLVVYADSVEGVLRDIELIGAALGEADAAAAITAGMRVDIEQVTAAVAQIEHHPRTFYQIGSEPEIYGPAPGSFVADMVELAGGEPVTTGDPNAFAIPVERLVAADPEVIVVGDAMYGVCPVDVVGRPGWGVMTAIREGDVRAVDDVPVTRPGPRLAQGLANLARAIHPELVLDGIPVQEAPCGSASAPSTLATR